jgi:hypothetical protein
MAKPINVTVLLVILALSSATMLYLLCRFPLLTSVISIAVLGILLVGSRFARSINSDASLSKGDREDPNTPQDSSNQ